jgi:hypothetical protein
VLFVDHDLFEPFDWLPDIDHDLFEPFDWLPDIDHDLFEPFDWLPRIDHDLFEPFDWLPRIDHDVPTTEPSRKKTSMTDIMEGIDPEAAPRAFEAVLPLLDAWTGERCSTNTSVPKAIVFAASVGRLVKQPVMRAVFTTLPVTHFDILHLDRLESVAMAAWHADLCTRTAEALVSGAKLPPDFLAGATVYKTRMVRVIEYNLDDIKEVVTELDSIRPGNGHMDLASDLMRLAVIFKAHAARLSQDTQRYQASDAEAAMRYATTIHQVLGDGRRSDAAYWSDYLSRAWSLMVTTYEEVAAAGRWLYRHDNGETMFPSLYAIGRQRRRRKPADEAGQEPGNEEPASPTTPAQP